MRKYQQLLLLIISCISVVVLFMYKTENNRLKDVLQVINFFGRNDAANLKKNNNGTMPIDYLVDYLHPLAVWQTIGDHFHGYSAYWTRNELIAGGEAAVLVVGLKRAVLNFRCTLSFRGSFHNVQGKFRFQRIDKDGDDNNFEFTRYNFFCRITRDFGLPESVTFVDLSTNSRNGRSIKLRYIKVMDEASKKLAVQPLTICVDMVTSEFQNVSVIEKLDSEILQFFVHHYTLGVEDFVIYNGDALPQNVILILRRFNIRLHIIPFNFPYSTQNASGAIQSIIETDCVLRSINRARHCLLLKTNEFLYPKAKLDSKESLLRSLYDYPNTVSRFELPVFAVCKNYKYKYLFQNTLYDPEIKSSHAITIHRPLYTRLSLNSQNLLNEHQLISLPLSQVFIHCYVNCIHAAKDGLHDWRNSLREDFMQHIQTLNKEIMVLI